MSKSEDQAKPAGLVSATGWYVLTYRPEGEIYTGGSVSGLQVPAPTRQFLEPTPARCSRR